MITLDRLITYLDSTMGRTDAVARIDPAMANGLQVRGRSDVNMIVTGVSASLRFFEEAVALGADAVVVHHALNMPAGIHFDEIFSRRLRYLFEHGLSLIGYHYLLDSHPEVGNNAQIIKRLGGTPTGPYPAEGWGWVGDLGEEAERDDLLGRCAALFGQVGTQYPFGPRHVRKIVALSGSGAPRPAEMEWLMRNRVDLFITGEPREWCREMFREAGISLVAAGHYATERLGVQAITAVLGRELDVAVQFLDLPNPT
jgi:dinuclear metal center YbgI/SA1388 family protein